MRVIGLEMLQAQLTTLPPEGWSILDLDWTPLWQVFAPLRLRSGYALRAYLFRAGRDSYSRVWAMPANAPVPAPPAADDEDAWQDAPPHALSSVMDGVEGDGTAWSYLAASLLGRELQGFAALGHAAWWREQALVIDESVDASSIEDFDPPPLLSAQAEAFSEINWQWRLTPPARFSPRVREDSHGVTVEFVSYSGLGEHTLTWHTDQFDAGSYLFRTTMSTIATASGGYLI
ncbi:MAG: hypothetical protein R2856_25525 [Caldilineaceae bacterium]